MQSMRFPWLTASLLKSVPGRLMLCLVLLAMVYRGAIPAGFMFGPAEAASGQLMMTFCVPGGDVMFMPVDLGDEQKTSSPDSPTVLECPFAAMAAQFLLPDAVALASQPVPRAYLSRFAVYRSAPALPAVGPPLGSRAPPSDLA